MIDDEKLVTEDIAGKWKKDEFVNVKYPIPDSMVKGKKEFRLTFKAESGMVGGIFGVRLLRNKPKPEPKDTVATTATAMTPVRPDLRARIYGGELQLEAGAPLPLGYTVRIFSMNGRLVKSQALPAGQASFRINIADMKNGTYVLRIQRDGYSYATTLFRKEQ